MPTKKQNPPFVEHEVVQINPTVNTPTESLKTESEAEYHAIDLTELNENVRKIARKVGSIPGSFIHGLISGSGYVIGGALALLIIGWLLNVVGVVPAFKDTAEQWRQVFIEAKDLKNK